MKYRNAAIDPTTRAYIVFDPADWSDIRIIFDGESIRLETFIVRAVSWADELDATRDRARRVEAELRHCRKGDA